MYRLRGGLIEVFLAHPGGPFFARKDAGHWTIPKGELGPGEEPLSAAIREFREETGLEPSGPFISLGAIRQKGGKEVLAWAFRLEGEDEPVIQSNPFEIEWPPRSGRKRAFPEIDQAQFFSLEEARLKIKETQRPFLDRLSAATADDTD